MSTRPDREKRKTPTERAGVWSFFSLCDETFRLGRRVPKPRVRSLLNCLQNVHVHCTGKRLHQPGKVNFGTVLDSSPTADQRTKSSNLGVAIDASPYWRFRFLENMRAVPFEEFCVPQ